MHLETSTWDCIQDITRPRAHTTTNSRPTSYRPQEKKSKHRRAASEHSTPFSNIYERFDTPNLPRKTLLHSLHSPGVSYKPSSINVNGQILTDSKQGNPRSGRERSDGPSPQEDDFSRRDMRDDVPHESDFRMAPGTPITRADSFMDVEVETDNSTQLVEEGRRSPSMETSEPNADASGYIFNELVDRLLTPVMSKTNAHFSVTFLCLYRKFASPSELLAAIWQRFENLQKLSQPHLLKLGAQLRYLVILARWLSEYPGDFAHPFCRARMTDFLNKLSANRVFGAAATEMSTQLDLVVEDDDTRWACSDYARGPESTILSFSEIPSMHYPMHAAMENPSLKGKEWFDATQDSISQDERRASCGESSKAPSSDSSLDQSTPEYRSFVSTPLTSVEAAQRQTQLLNPTARISLTKVQWHQFMDISDEDIARELTRIDWILYSAIRPRDIVRHVSLTLEQRSRCGGLEYVNRMIDHFNHVAFWAASMVLLRDKAKHRARILEKFMSIAWVSD